MPLLFVAPALGCGGDEAPVPRSGAQADPARPAGSADARPTIVFLGTSLTAGLGLDLEQAYPAVVQRKLDSAGLAYRVVNAGVSGQTSAGSLAQIDWVLQRERPAVLVIETGANDGLRGLNVDSMRANIQAIVDRARRQTPPPRIVLVGMQTLRNLGEAYRRRFNAAFDDLARTNDVPVVPFLLEGIGGVERLNQADGIHPTAEGAERAADNVWAVLEPVVRQPPQ